MRAIYAQRTREHSGSEAANRLLRYALHRAVPDAPTPLLRARQKNGKPYLPDYPGFHFSLSHSGGWAVCAVSEFPLGVDLERVRELRRCVPERWFSTAECRLLAQLPADAFFTFWTLKEAAVKASGEGLARGLTRANVTLEDGPVLRTEDFCGFPVRFPDKNYRLSLCISRADSGWTEESLRVIVLR